MNSSTNAFIERPVQMKRTPLTLVASIGFAAILCGPSAALAQTAPSLGSAQSFAVLGASTVTNTGATVLTGDLGVSPGTAVTGFPPGIVNGTIHAADAAALAAQTSVTTAYNSLASQTCTQDLTGQDLGGKTLTAGVYCFSTSAQLTGTLTLNAQGNANAVFIFKMGSTLTTAANSVAVVSNGGQNSKVFWQVGSSATLGTGTRLAGNVLAFMSITVTTGAQVSGRALARNGAVTLDTNTLIASVPLALPSPPPPVISTAPIALVLPNPCTGGFVLVTGSMSVQITTTPGIIGLNFSGSGQGDDALADGTLITNGTQKPKYNYTSAMDAEVGFPAQPSYFQLELPITTYLQRVVASNPKDSFLMKTGLELTFTNGVPAAPIVRNTSVRCE
jgi:hypothetical protein